MPRQKKKTAAGKPNKSAFVRSLAFDTPSAEVIARAKAQGMALTRNDVHAIRAIARRKEKPAARASRGRAGSGGINKSAFVRSLPGDMSAADVIAQGKAKGIRLSAAQIYTIRANARRKGGSKIQLPAMGRGSKLGKGPRMDGGRATGSREADFVAAVLDLGLNKAEALINALRAKAISALT